MSVRELRRVKNISSSIGLIPIIAATALAHYTWVYPVHLPLAVGKTCAVQISHGHAFPKSEEAINFHQVELFALAPSGAKVKLEPSAAGSAVIANYDVKEPGLHRLVMIQNRGVMSRTSSGVQPGGRDKHPDAVQASRTVRTAVTYAPTSNTTAVSGKPAGLEIELVGEYSKESWNVQLLKEGKAVPAATIEVFIAGIAQPVYTAKTGADGRLSYKPAAGAKGPILFSAELKEPPPAGAKYDFVNYSASLAANW